MGIDYTAAVTIRYALLALAMGATHLWLLPADSQATAIIVVLAWTVIVIHAEPAGRYARLAPEPWSWWMMLYAARVHAFAAAAAVVAHPLWPRFQPPPASGEGMEVVVPWVREYSLLSVGVPIAVYAVLSGLFACMVGAEARDRLGVVDPDEHLVRIRRRPRQETPSQ